MISSRITMQQLVERRTIDTAKRKDQFLVNATGLKIANFIYTMFQNKYTAVELGTNPFYTGSILGKITGPWEVNQAKDTFPKVVPNIWISTPPVPDDYPRINQFTRSQIVKAL